MRAVRGMLVAAAVLVLAGSQAFADAKSDAEKALMGKWETKQKVGEKEIKAELNFDKDGKLAMKVNMGPGMDLNFDGKYKVIDEKTIEVTITFMGQTRTEKSTFKVSKDTLE